MLGDTGIGLLYLIAKLDHDFVEDYHSKELVHFGACRRCALARHVLDLKGRLSVSTKRFVEDDFGPEPPGFFDKPKPPKK